MNPIFLSKSVSSTSKKSPVRIFAIAASAAMILSLGMSSCATTQGFGRDLEHVGDEIQEAAR